jgi:hypothetical protein
MCHANDNYFFFVAKKKFIIFLTERWLDLVARRSREFNLAPTSPIIIGQERNRHHVSVFFTPVLGWEQPAATA